MVNHFKGRLIYLLLITFSVLTAEAQNYHAVNGSSYAGSLGVANNPASTVNAPSTWDVDIFSTQIKYTTNAATIYKYSLLSSAAESQYAFDNGNFKRYATFNYNTNILNTRIAIGRKQAITFGMNVRGFGDAMTSAYNYIDTIKKINQLLKLNNDRTIYEMEVLHSSWVEIFGSYARTIWDDETSRLNAGITLKVSRGISGAHASLRGVQFEKLPNANTLAYQLTGGSVAYGYSSNYDVWSKNRTTGVNLTDFLTHTEGGVSIDAGVEYLMKSQEVTSFDDEENYYDYEWKFGISLLDAGQNNYKYGVNSRAFNSVKPNIADATLQRKFTKIKSLRNFNDSLASVVSNSGRLGGIFTIINPVRLVLNADRNLRENFYVNAELSINLASLAGDKKMYMEELNLATVTPRWETMRWGAYLPFTYSTHRKLWIGGAVKAGPILLGIHNWGNVFSSKKMSNGGGYIALVVRPNNVTREVRDKRFDCPKF